VPGWLPVGFSERLRRWNHPPSTTALDVTLADGSRERIDAEKVFVADASLMFSVAGHPTHIFGDAGSLGRECS
jgi:hypothetical protein